MACLCILWLFGYSGSSQWKTSLWNEIATQMRALKLALFHKQHMLILMHPEKKMNSPGKWNHSFLGWQTAWLPHWETAWSIALLFPKKSTYAHYIKFITSAKNNMKYRYINNHGTDAGVWHYSKPLQTQTSNVSTNTRFWIGAQLYFLLHWLLMINTYHTLCLANQDKFQLSKREKEKGNTLNRNGGKSLRMHLII